MSPQASDPPVESAALRPRFHTVTLKVLGGRVDSVTAGQATQFVEQTIEKGAFAQIITVNLLMLQETQKDRELEKIFDEAGLVAADSIGIRWIAALKGLPLTRIPGIDLLTELCGKADQKGWRIFLVGAKPGIAAEAGNRLLRRYPGLKICGTAHGYFSKDEEARILREIREKKPNLVFVGLKIPFQEKWIHTNLSFLKGACAMGVGGSFDVLSGKLKRAPAWVQTLGFEWLFRMIQEPWRWKRALVLPLVLFQAVFASCSISKIGQKQA